MHTRAHAGQIVVGRHDDAGLTLDRLDEHGDGVVVDRGGQRVGVAERHRAETRGVGAEAAARSVVVGEADDRRRAAVEVVLRHHDVALAGRHALDVGAPFAGDLDAALDGLGAAVHRQHHVLAAQLGQRLAERSEPVGVEGSADQRHRVELSMRGRDDLGVAVPEVHRRVRSQAVQVAPALDVGDPGALGAGRDDGQWRVVVRGVAVIDGDRVGRRWRHGVKDGHEYTSSVQHLIDPPPFNSSDRSTPIGTNPASESWSAKPVAAAGMDDVAGRRRRR